ncbi:carboxypeptidase regulatory-like domain-containing protein [Stieleria varia]|uniref:Nickel uptake substrate-specific transmembrane region n=1 Tax=Stieleria varia TaxID=2528005 RepID=A0A5C6AMP9_9BACT|nr:carboxypeptidase regulatory-like domain-containing protein [Stieleria varia]TWU01333.1 Nickel uptake substrate-specific transmembrane region [Stieleria varia]
MSSALIVRTLCVSILSIGYLCSANGQDANAKNELEPLKGAPLKGALFGRLIDKEGEPVTDAEISLQGDSYFRTISDEHGRYVFEEKITPGEYRIRIQSKGWVGFTNYRELPRITLEPDKQHQQDFTLPRACKIEILVHDKDGNPIRAAVYCKSTDGDDFSNTDRHTTDKEGKLTIGGLKPQHAKYLIGVRSESHAPDHVYAEVTDPDKVSAFEITLEPGVSIKGNAVCSDGLPPAGWNVLALPTWWNFGSYPRGTEIGEDGSFVLPHIGPGEYNVSVSIPLGDGMSTSRNILTAEKLTEMQQPVQGKMDYPSPKSMNYLTCQIRWIGKPLERGFSISGYCAQTQHHISHHVGPNEKEVRIGPIPKGIYRIRPESPELEVMNLRKIKNLDDLDDVAIPNEEPLQLVLRARGKPHVQGIVTDEATGKPISVYQFRVAKHQTLSGPNYVQDDAWKVAKSAAGEFETEVIGPGIYSVSVLAEGYAIATSEMVNTDEAPDEMISIKLKPEVPFHGVVLDPDGNPVDGATVRASQLAGGAMPRTLGRFVTDKGAVKTVDGKFTLHNLAAGWTSIRVEHPEFVFAELPQQVVSLEAKPLTVTLSKGATIHGQVFDADGNPQPNETLQFYDDYAYGGGDREAGFFGKTTTDDQGRYRIDRMPSAPVYISRKDEWQGIGVVRHAVTAQDGMDHEVNFGGKRRMRGRYLVNGEPLANTRLQIGGHDSTFGAMKMYVSTDDQGNFTFHGPPPGQWVLYRELDGQRSEWAKVREVDIPRSGDVDLGLIEHKLGTLTVRPRMEQGELPEGLYVKLRAYSDDHYFGRDAAVALPRTQPHEPFVFEQVAPGDLELVCSGAGTFSIQHRLLPTDDFVNTTLPLEIPHGEATVTIRMRDADGEPSNEFGMMLSEDSRILFYLQEDKQEPGLAQVNGVPDGNYVLRSGNMRHSTIIGRLEVAGGKDVEVQFTVPSRDNERPGFVNVNVVDQNRVVVPVAIEIISPDLENDESIRFRPFHLYSYLYGKQGDVRIKIDHPGYEPVEQTVTLKPTGTENDVTVVLNPKS